MTTETQRTGSIENQKRNIRNRIALLTLRGISRPLTTDETQELKDLQAKLSELEKQS
jgi:hypothetical protein